MVCSESRAADSPPRQAPAGRLTAAGNCSRGPAARRRPSPVCSHAAPGGWRRSARRRGSAHHRRCWPRSGLLRAAELPVSGAWGCLPWPGTGSCSLHHTQTHTHGPGTALPPAPSPPGPGRTPPSTDTLEAGLAYAGPRGHTPDRRSPARRKQGFQGQKHTHRLASEVRGSEENEEGEGWLWCSCHRGGHGGTGADEEQGSELSEPLGKSQQSRGNGTWPGPEEKQWYLRGWRGTLHGAARARPGSPARGRRGWEALRDFTPVRLASRALGRC